MRLGRRVGDAISDPGDAIGLCIGTLRADGIVDESKDCDGGFEDVNDLDELLLRAFVKLEFRLGESPAFPIGLFPGSTIVSRVLVLTEYLVWWRRVHVDTGLYFTI